MPYWKPSKSNHIVKIHVFSKTCIWYFEYTMICHDLCKERAYIGFSLLPNPIHVIWIIYCLNNINYSTNWWSGNSIQVPNFRKEIRFRQIPQCDKYLGKKCDLVSIYLTTTLIMRLSIRQPPTSSPLVTSKNQCTPFISDFEIDHFSFHQNPLPRIQLDLLFLFIVQTEALILKGLGLQNKTEKNHKKMRSELKLKYIHIFIFYILKRQYSVDILHASQINRIYIVNHLIQIQKINERDQMGKGVWKGKVRKTYYTIAC